MTSESIVRLLVTFDCTQPNERVLRELVRLLSPAELDVTGLYVEDEDLLRAATLPGLREISLSGQEAALDAARLIEDLAREAVAAERSFENLARRLMAEHDHLQHRFRVTRGRIGEELTRAATESDFVVVTRALRASGLRPRLARTYQDLLQRSRHVLFVNEPWGSGSSVVVLHGNDTALDYAARLAAAEGLRLVIALPPGEAVQADLQAVQADLQAVQADLQAVQGDLQAVQAAVQAMPLLRAPAIRHLPDYQEELIAELCLREDARLLVMPPRAGLDWQELLLSLADRLPCSLLKLG